MAYLLNHNFQMQSRGSNGMPTSPYLMAVQNKQNSHQSQQQQRLSPTKFVINHFDDSYPIDAMPPMRTTSTSRFKADEEERYSGSFLNTINSNNNSEDDLIFSMEDI
ncbi:hypothetical protein SAMD00019534_008090 [Acytostelium subglobosum LB1]|uniref:hypothetical protein n=1 Tax=Acytostelium subglobosum LB1 TaxID=1410327 RepID=UPI0006452227|nr:hypothetical protein SAMD00019534_008090 [Acytostelium subglobosum LB1]GAM17634.1 hypothetical protein SAMD00019534_008090 [Acytostelium subglobosum LB1]|eukprot:XP_012758230.1 hypothetical protein SAMD00019534_008090 [Acytostelium subglobosum LB1]